MRGGEFAPARMSQSIIRHGGFVFNIYLRPEFQAESEL